MRWMKKCFVLICLIYISSLLCIIRMGVPLGLERITDIIELQARSSELFNSHGTDISSKQEKLMWEKGSFCHEHIVDTYHELIPVCGEYVTVWDQVKCFASKHSKHTARCAYENLAIKVKKMKKVFPNDFKWVKPRDPVANLVQSENEGVKCSLSSFKHLQNKTESGSYSLKLTKHVARAPRVKASTCDIWINKTTFLHVSNGLHVYFRFLSLYNIHQTLLHYGFTGDRDTYQVLRIGHLGNDYKFAEFDKALFPGALSLNDLPENSTVCFKNAVLVPRSYQSVLFRCKMDSKIVQQCFQCNGSGLTDSPLLTFRKRVLDACSIRDGKTTSTKSLLFISRKAYKRWSSDDPEKFERILMNEAELIAAIRNAFPNVTVRIVHMEDLDICEQVRFAVEADVVLGVHGAGLVHFWWLRDKAVGIELEPLYEAGNPSFRMLTTLAGRRYIGEQIKVVDDTKNVTANVPHILNLLKKNLR